MIALAKTAEKTQKVRRVYPDGTVIETVMTARMARILDKMDEEEERAEKRYRKHVKTATDAKVNPNRIVRRGESPWTGPRFRFRLYLGDSAIWGGPASLWLTRDGSPCEPGQEPYLTSNGRLRARRGGVIRCRLCGHLKRLPPYAVCLNDACSRTGHEDEIHPAPPPVAPPAQRHDGLQGGRGVSPHASTHAMELVGAR